MKPTVLVTDGNQRAALAVVRSLGVAGYRCLVGGTDSPSLAGASKHASQTFVLPDPTQDPSAYGARVAQVVHDERVAIVMPITEASILAILPMQDRMTATVPVPPMETFVAICNKAQVLRTADRLGIRVPVQRELLVSATVADLDIPLPVVLKPSRSVFTSPDGSRGKVGVRWARSLDDLRRGLEGYPAAAFPVLVQEAITGPGVGVFLLVHEGRILAQFSHRRVREKPPSGGVSVLRQSEPMDPDLLERSRALLEQFGWSGVAMVEYKRDAATGEAVLMEINGRFWGSLQLAIDAGVDFPRLLADVSLGRNVEPVTDYAFVRNRWFWGDVDHVLARWRDRPVSWRDGLRSLGGFLRSFGPGYRSDVFRWRDPGPFVVESKRWFRDIIG